MTPYPALTLSPDEKVLLNHRRTKALKQLRHLSFVMLFGSIVSIVTGMIILVYATDKTVFPLNTGSSIWSGCLLMVTSCIGLWTSWSHPDDNEENITCSQLKGKIITFYVLSITSISICGLSMSYCITGLVYCQTSDCFYHKSVVTTASVLAIITALLLLVCAIIGSVFYCVYRRAFFLFSSQDRINQLQRHVLIQDQRISSLMSESTRISIGNQFSQTGNVYDSKNEPFNTNYQTIFDPPPPYKNNV